MIGYILISLCDSVDEKKVLDKFSEMEEVSEAHLLFGEWDVILRIDRRDPRELSAFVLDKLRPLKEIKMTSTLIVAK